MVVLCDLKAVFKLGKPRQLCFIKFERLCFHAFSKNVNDISQYLKDQPRDNLQNLLHYFD